MIDKVISGGQTGADQAGWRAALSAGIATGGWMPKGFLTEDGKRPEFAGLYGAREHFSEKYPPRTYANAKDSDATIWFGVGDSRGYACTRRAVLEQNRTFIVVDEGIRPSEIVRRIRHDDFRILNIAGNRESMSPGIGERVEKFLRQVFCKLKDIP